MSAGSPEVRWDPPHPLQAWRWLALLLLIATLMDTPLLAVDFIWDDEVLIRENRMTDSWARWMQWFQTDLWSTTTQTDRPPSPYYRPLMLASLTLDRSLFGWNAAGHHLHSLLWHLSCVALTWRLAMGWRMDPVSATLCSAVVALHPLHLELVAFLAARNDSMAAAAVLGMLIVCERPTLSRQAQLSLAALMAFAALSKESAVLGLPLLILADRIRWRRWLPWRRYLGASMGLSLMLLLRLGVELESVQLTASAPLLGELLGFSARVLLWPFLSQPIYYLQGDMTLGLWLLPALAAGGALLRYGGRMARVGLLLAALAWLPSTLAVAHTDLLSQRYLYLPLCGLSLALHGLELGRTRRLELSMIGLGLLIAASWIQLPAWTSTRSLWTQAYREQPDPRTACGLFKDLEGDPQERQLAARLLEEAVTAPVAQHCCLRATAWSLQQGSPEEAVHLGEQALDQGCLPSGELIAPLALSKAFIGDWGEAVRLSEGLQRDPFGYRALILSAYSLDRGDPQVLEDWLERGSGDGEQLRSSVMRLLQQTRRAPSELP